MIEKINIKSILKMIILLLLILLVILFVITNLATKRRAELPSNANDSKSNETLIAVECTHLG